MNNNRLEALLLLSYVKDLTDSVNISKVAKLWVQINSRRIVLQKEMFNLLKLLVADCFFR